MAKKRIPVWRDQKLELLNPSGGFPTQSTIDAQEALQAIPQAIPQTEYVEGVGGRYPRYLTCPYCLAQAIPGGTETLKYVERKIVVYLCPAKHKFYINPDARPGVI